MKVLLRSAGPHVPLRPTLESVLLTAEAIDASVAFVTGAGVEFLSKIRSRNSTAHIRVAVSVRWPSNLRAIADFARKNPGTVYIHLAGASPHEKGGDSYQMHSKVVAAQTPAGGFEGFVGSHNWTYTGLEGSNLECTMQVSCSATDPVAREIVAHIEACIAECEVFEPGNLDLYLTIQRDLHPSPPPGTDEEVDGFEKRPTLIIHAEAPSNLMAQPSLRVFIGPGDDFAEEFSFERDVDLYLYPPGTLLTQPRPTAVPVYFTGTITMVNTKSDAHVQVRQVDSAIFDLQSPTLQPTATFPNIPTAVREIAIRVENKGRRTPYVYHSGVRQSRPAVKNSVQYEDVPIPGLDEVDPEMARRYLRKPNLEQGVLHWARPSSVRREISVSVPNPDVYPEGPERLLLGDQGARPETFQIGPQASANRVLRDENERVLVHQPRELRSRFFYSATHRSKR